MKISSLLSLVLTALLLTAGCASTSLSSRPPDTSRDVTEMKERILELQEKAAMAEVEIERLRQQVVDLEQRLAMLQDGEAPVAEIERAAPTTSTSPPPVSSPAPAQTVEESDLEPESATGLEVPGDVGGAGAQPTASPPAATGPPPTSQPVGPAAQALYDRGYTLLHQGRYLDAEASFQRFLQAYPATELSDNAQFWIGESRFARGDFPGALAAFRETRQRYPDGNKVADALIKEGDCLVKLGDQDGARSRFEEVQRRFPTSAAAVMAEERLAALD